MTDTKQPKPFKPKNWQHIHGNCKMAKLSDGYIAKNCPDCGTNHKLRCCPWCGHVRSKKK